MKTKAKLAQTAKINHNRAMLRIGLILSALLVAAAFIFGCSKRNVLVNGQPVDVEAYVASLPMEPAQAQEEAYQEPREFHEVQPGECLWKISELRLRDPFKWPLIWRENRDFITDPDWIEVGDRLDLPLGASAQDEGWARGVAGRWPKEGRSRESIP